MKLKYFLHLNTGNLSQYFTRGIILPSASIEGWINDMQSIYKNGLLLCKEPLVKETKCSLEIVLTETEAENLVKLTDFFHLYSKPLPISRIKKIFFTEPSQSKKTIYNIENGDAFVPKELIKIIDNRKEIDYPERKELDELKQDWSIKNKLYNQVLGGLALLKIGKINDYKNYSDNYFNYLSYINNKVGMDNKNVASADVKQFIKVLRVDNDKSKSNFFAHITNELVDNYYREKFNKSLTIKRGNILIQDTDDTITYILSILATYGNDLGKTKKIDDFIYAVCNNKFKGGLIENICFTFGINQGYSSFYNKYQFDNKEIIIKFKLDSELDYSIIESVYQYIYNQKSDNYHFNYINDWCPKFHNIIDTSKFETYKIFDKLIIHRQKTELGSKEYLQELFNSFETNDLLAPLFNLLNENALKSFRDMLGLNFEKVRNDMNLELDVLKKEKEHLKEENIGLRRENEDLINKSKEVIVKSTTPNDKKSTSSLVFQPEIPLIITNTEDVKILNRSNKIREINKIGELKIIAKYIGIKSVSRFSLKEIDELRNLIIEKEKEELN
jgi:hypothetical protein